MAAASEDTRAGVKTYWTVAAGQRIAHLNGIFPNSNAEAVKAARQAIENEVEAARFAVCSMLTRQNALAPISMLPDEILSVIFQFYALAFPLEIGSYSRSGRKCRLAWIEGTTHVCWHWRRVALDTVGLWETISFGIGPRWTEEMIARVRMAPISIVQTLPYSNPFFRGPQDHRSILSTHMHHIRNVLLTGKLEDMESILPHLTGPAPALEKLELVLNPIVPNQCHIPSTLFGSSSQIREVTLKGLSCSWAGLPVGNITRLSLSPPRRGATDTSHPSASTFEEFLSVLDEMPNLQFLSLHECIPSPSAIQLHVVRLSYLYELDLCGPSNNVLGVLQNVAIPAQAKLHLQCASDTEDECLTVLPHVVAHLSRGNTIQNLKLDTLRLQNAMSLRVTALTHDEAKPSSPTPDGAADLCMAFVWPRSESYTTLSAVRKVYSNLPLSNLQSLSLDVADCELSEPQWSEISNQCRLVNHLRVTSHQARALFPVLRTPEGALVRGEADHKYHKNGRRAKKEEEAKKKRIREQLIFPHLMTLVIYDVDFENSETAPSGSRGISSLDPLYETLGFPLEERMSCGATIKRLEINECTIDPDQLGSFEDYVGHLEWDGDVGEFRPFDSDEESEEELGGYRGHSRRYH